MHRSPNIRLALQTDDQEYASQQDEISALKTKLRAAEATIAGLASKARSPESQHTEEASFEDSRFPLFRRAQSQAQSALGKLWAEDEDKLTTLPETGRDQASDGHLTYLAEEAVMKSASNASVEQLFQRYDADNSGQIDIDEFRQFLQDASRGVVEAIPSFPEFSVGEEGRRFGEWSKETYGTAETMAYETAEKTAETLKGTAKSVVDAVYDLGAAAAASMPGASAAVPLTLVGGVGSGYKEIIAAGQLAQVPVIELIVAVERQVALMSLAITLTLTLTLALALALAPTPAPTPTLILALTLSRTHPKPHPKRDERQAALTTQLGGFMQLIVKLDQANMRTVRQAWEKHGRPVTVRELLAAEVADGVQEPSRLTEVCATEGRQPQG